MNFRIALITAVCVICGISPDAQQPIRRLTLEPSEGWVIFDPTRDGIGYRYGPSLILRPDGTLDAWFSSPGGWPPMPPQFPEHIPFGSPLFKGLDPPEGYRPTKGDVYQWDWIRHKQSHDGGKTWGPERVVLTPTPWSRDQFSVCDPGVIKLGDWYYLGVTAVDNEAGHRNEVFVSRSRRADGPFEKWNGSGWGGKPMPIVPYRTPVKAWGAGEPSFVRVGNTLFIYYSLHTSEAEQGGRRAINRTMVATAPADREDWPAHIKFRGVCWDRLPSEDSADVKYVPRFRRFIAVSTASRLTADSFIAVRTSVDGLRWSEPIALKTHLRPWLHNCGLSSGPDGQIDVQGPVYLGYAYSDQPGVNWALWYTMLHPVTIREEQITKR